MSREAKKILPARAAQTGTGANGADRGLSPKWLCIVLAFVSFAVYANTLQNGYVLDDATVITKNTIVTQGLKGIPELLATPRLKGFEQSKDEESYRPVPMISHAVEFELFGANAGAGHLFNILFFVGCVIALFICLDKLFAGKMAAVAFVAALLFAVHPIHTEVVANIKSRDELLCFLFAFLSLNAFINFARDGKKLHLFSGALLLLLSLFSKETSISFLLVIPLVFFFYVNENRRRSLFICAAALLAVAVFIGVRAAVLPAHHSNAVIFLSNPLIAAPGILPLLATAFLVLGSYLILLVLPYPLICDYSYNSVPLVGFNDPFALLSATLYLFITAATLYRLIKIRRDPWAFSGLFFAATIALFSNVLYLVYSQMAERFLFFASAGFCLFIALVLDRWVIKSARNKTSALKSKRTLIVLAPICLSLATLTFLRNADWKDNYTLFRADLEKSPNNCALNYFVANELQQGQEGSGAGSPTQADLESIAYLKRAVTIYPDYSEAHAALGSIYDRLRMFDSAIRHDTRALAINPANSIASYNLARAYYFRKQYQEAIEYFKKTLSLQPGLVTASLNLARCYTDARQYDSAIAYFNKTLVEDPSQELAVKGLAYAKSMSLRADSAATTKDTIKISQGNETN